jgi:chorismate mutase
VWCRGTRPTGAADSVRRCFEDVVAVTLAGPEKGSPAPRRVIHTGSMGDRWGRVSAALFCAVVVWSGTACAGPPAAGASATTRPAGDASTTTPPAALDRLVAVAADRLGTADIVAAAKWVTGGSVTDPARERAVLDAAATGAAQRGLDTSAVTPMFRDQIEASKVVQYGLFSDWSGTPEHAPAAGQDLAAVRPVLDRATGDLLDALVATRAVRAAADCPAALRRSASDLEDTRRLDPLHRAGLARALRSVCG